MKSVSHQIEKLGIERNRSEFFFFSRLFVLNGLSSWNQSIAYIIDVEILVLINRVLSVWFLQFSQFGFLILYYRISTSFLNKYLTAGAKLRTAKGRAIRATFLSIVGSNCLRKKRNSQLEFFWPFFPRISRGVLKNLEGEDKRPEESGRLLPTSWISWSRIGWWREIW